MQNVKKKFNIVGSEELNNLELSKLFQMFNKKNLNMKWLIIIPVDQDTI